MHLCTPRLRRFHHLLIWFGLIIAVLGGALPARAQGGFSFVVFGHSKSFYYLPGGRDQSADMRRMVSRRHPGRTVQLYYGVNGLELERLVLGAGSSEPRLEVSYREGWPQRIVSWQQDKPRITMRRAGRRWVFDQVAGLLWQGARNLAGGSLFVVHGGDAVPWGGQGRSLNESPYWQRFKSDFLDRLPPPDQKRGQPSRVFMTLGPGESREDPRLEGVLSTLPGLAKTGLSSEARTYHFGFQRVRFIFLDSGNADEGAWNSCCPAYRSQMDQLDNWLNQALKQGYRQVFIFVARPPFSQAGPALPPGSNPHQVLKRFAGRLGITVISSAAATTEAYEIDQIRYLVLGGGGGMQNLAPGAPKKAQPEEMYWQGWERQEEYNYLLVRVEQDRAHFTLRRFRPLDLKSPFSQKTIFK